MFSCIRRFCVDNKVRCVGVHPFNGSLMVSRACIASCGKNRPEIAAVVLSRSFGRSEDKRNYFKLAYDPHGEEMRWRIHNGEERSQWRRKISEWSSAVANPHRGRSISEWVITHISRVAGLVDSQHL